MSERTSTIRSRELGRQLRRFREKAGLNQRWAAGRIGISTPSLSRIEDGTKTPTPEEVSGLLAVYGVTGAVRDILISIAREAHQRGWWQRHNPKFGERLNTLADMESRACTITTFSLGVVPGLLQSPVYTEALMRCAGDVRENEIKARVEARIVRQQILLKEDPVHMAAFIDESVLYRMPGSGAVMHRQLDHFLQMAEKSNLIIRIVPLGRSAKAAADGSFKLLRFPEAPAIAYTEHLGYDVYLEEPEEVVYYDDAVHHLLDAALDTGESVGLITRLMHKLEEDPDVLPEIPWPPLAEE